MGSMIVDHIYPATGQPNGTVTLAGAREIDHAVRAAAEAQREWVALTVDRRRDLLIDLADVVHDRLDELAGLNVADYGVPISFAGTALLLDDSSGISRATSTSRTASAPRSTGHSTSISSSGSPMASSPYSRRGTAPSRLRRRAPCLRWPRATPWS